MFGSGFGASDGVEFVVNEDSTDTLESVPGKDNQILVCKFWGDTVITYLKADLNPRAKAFNKCPIPEKFYCLA